MKHLKLPRIFRQHKVIVRILVISLFLITLSTGELISRSMSKNNQNSNGSSKVSTVSTSAQTQTPQKTEQPANTSNNSSSAGSAPKSSTAANEAAEYQKKANEAASKAAELNRCLTAENSAYGRYKATRDSLSDAKHYQTDNVFSDKRLNLYQAEAIVRYANEKYNSGVNAAYQTYLSSMNGQNCTPSSEKPSNYSTPANYPDLMANYPYLANYPNVVL